MVNQKEIPRFEVRQRIDSHLLNETGSDNLIHDPQAIF